MRIQAYNEYPNVAIETYGHEYIDKVAESKIGALMGQELLKFTTVNKKKKEYADFFIYHAACHVISEENFNDIMKQLHDLKMYHGSKLDKFILQRIIDKLNR